MAERWLSVKETAVELGESEKTVRRLIAARKLAVRRAGVTGRHLLIAASALATYVRATTTPATPSLMLGTVGVAIRSDPSQRPGFKHGRDCAPRICDVCRAARAAR